jgi:[acyl-carrier-protein] S-malonyltransferase
MTFGQDPVSPTLKRFMELPADPGLALLFPGQGSQKPGMGRDAHAASKAAREVFASADRALGFEIRRLCFEGPDHELTRTENAQPAILITSVALLLAALESGVLNRRPAFLAGHSLGEYTALVAAGALAFEDALRLVRERGRLMAEAGRETPGTMAAIVGLGEDDAIAICDESKAEPCNFNAATQVVVGGTPEAVERACRLAKGRGGRGLPMNVAGAFHTSRMAGAAAKFTAILDTVTANPPVIPVLGNVTGRVMTTAGQCMADLAQQIQSPVLWHQSIIKMRNAGVNRFTEFGPGKALITMLKRDWPEATLISLDGPAVVTSPTNV